MWTNGGNKAARGVGTRGTGVTNRMASVNVLDVRSD